MIKSVTIINHLGESCKITLNDSEPAHGLMVTKITGIGPGEAQINDSDYATNDGSEFNSARLSSRSIQITILLSDEYPPMTIEKARHNAYRYLPVKKQVRLIFETDERNLYIDGRVEKNVPDIFSPSESLSIDIKCSDPYFYKYIPGSVDSTESVDIMSILPAFEFTYDENVDDGELVNPYEVGEYTAPGDLITTVVYDGEVENGFVGKITLNGELQGDIILSRYQRLEYFRIFRDRLLALVGSLNVGDVIEFSTEPKHCYCKIIQNGVETNVLNAVDLVNSTWMTLNPGENTFVYAILNGSDNTQLELIYKTLFQGV